MNRKVKNKLNKRGFSLVELLAVIVIVGALSVLAIAGVTRYVDSARREKVSQDKKNVSMAAQLYLQSNRELYPKLIGDDTRVSLSDLKTKNYLKESIKNDEGEDCMEKSFVRVYKLNEGEYSYTTYLYCGEDKVPADVVEKPVVTNFKFTGGEKNSSGSFNDVKDAKFSFTMKGSSKSDDVGIYSYSYSIYVKTTNDESEAYTQVFDSESIKGGFEPTITVTSKSLSNYMSLTGYSNIRVDVHVINEQGGKTDFTNIEGNYEDKQAPICGTIEGQAENDDDWINKKSFGDKDAIIEGSTRKYPARVSVDCSDGFGSGCKRDRFTRSWPNDYDSVSGIDYNFGARWSYITLEDNTGNSTDCFVRTNVDLQAPTVTVKIYKAKADGKKGDLLLTKEVKDTNSINATMPSIVINAKDFANVVGVGDEKWMNKDNYPNGIIIDAEITDNLYLYSYDWSTNNKFVAGGTGNSAVAATLSTANGSAEQDNGVKSSDKFTSTLKDNPTTKDELKAAEHGALSGKVEGLRLKFEGKRYAELKVCDKAGNCSYVKIYANMDRTAPAVPTVSYAWQDNINKTYAPGANNESYELHWINHKISAFVVDQKEDHQAPNNTGKDLSGWNKFVYEFTEQDQSKKATFKQAVVKDASTNYSKGIGFDITTEGVHKVRFRSCDKAGNCSSYSDYQIVKVDLTKPTCGIKSTYSHKKNAAGWLKAGQSVTLEHTCDDVKVYGSGCNASKYKDEKTTYSTDINTKKAGVAGDESGGYVYDYAGNKSNECPKNFEVKIDTKKPTCNVKATYKNTKKPNDDGWLKNGESVTLSLTCNDPTVTSKNVSSGCDTSNAANKQTTTYSTDIIAPNAGAAGNKQGGNVYDIAGNMSDTCPTMEVKIDTQAPVCTTKATSGGSDYSGAWLGAPGGTKKTAVVTQVCKDSEKNGIKSDCKGTMASYTYNKEINTTKAGAGGDGNGGGKVYDAAGNASANCPTDKTVRIDYTAPSCTPKATLNTSSGSAYTSNTWTNQSVVLTAQCTEKGSYKSGCQANKTRTYSDDMSSSVKFAYSATYSLSGGDPEARAYDNAGNYTNCSATYTIKIDKTAPAAKCAVTSDSKYNKDSDQKFAVTNQTTNTTKNSVASPIKTTNYKLDGGSYSTSSSKNLACGTSARTATASIKVTDEAGNTAEASCSGSVPVPGCCDSKTGWINGSTCTASCGGGTYNRYKNSNYNGTQCEYQSSGGSPCNTQSCCSDSNPWGCTWVTACRTGMTAVYNSSNKNDSTFCGTVYHEIGGRNDRLYVLGYSGNGVRAYVSSFYQNWGCGNIIYIYSNCIGGHNSVCPYSQCPG